MHRLFTAFFLIGILGALVQLLCGYLQAPARVVSALWEAADLAVEVSLGLIGVLALWSGLFRLAEQSRLADRMAARFVGESFSYTRTRTKSEKRRREELSSTV